MDSLSYIIKKFRAMDDLLLKKELNKTLQKNR